MKNRIRQFKEKDLSKISGGSNELVFNVKPGVKINANLELIDNRQVKNVHNENIIKVIEKEKTTVDIL